MKISHLFLFVSIPISLTNLDATAGTIIGPGQSADVEEGDVSEEWGVSNGATLNLKQGAEAASISLSGGSKLTATNSTINHLQGHESAIRAVDSTVELNDTNINHNVEGEIGYVTVSLLGPSTTLVMNGGSLTSTGRGFNIFNDAKATLNGINARVSTAAGAYPNDLEGIVVNLVGGDINVADSTLSGQRNTMIVVGERSTGVDYTSYANFSNSALSSDEGSIIKVYNPIVNRFYTPTAIISLSNGTTVSAGNGTLLEVDNAVANLTIDDSDIKGNVIATTTGDASVNLNNQSFLTGRTSGVNRMTVNKTGTWNVTDSSDVKTLINDGTIAFESGRSGRVLSVKGDYAGNDGLIIFNTVLGDDNSQTDKLAIDGDSSGTTKVAVNNLGGSGADTVQGIELISVQGNSGGEFIQQGRIVAGAYDYRLVRGEGAQSKNWYLSNKSDPVTPPVVPPVVDPVVPPVIDPEVPPVVDPVVPPVMPEELILRPEAGAYSSNNAAANTLFISNLEDRLGETEYTDLLTGEKRLTSLWLRNSGGHTRANESSGQLRTQSNRYVMMIGGDIASGNSFGYSTWRYGALAGYGNNKSNTVSRLTSYSARGEVEGYTVGLYGTWYSEGTDEKGSYLDSVLQYSWFDNTVKGEDIQSESYTSKGLTLSFEAGHVHDMGASSGNAWYLQPNAKIYLSGIDANTHTESNGTRISSTGDNNLQTSIGIKSFLKIKNLNRSEKNSSVKPFAELNWIHNTKDYGAKMDEIAVTQSGTRDLAEIKVGIEGRVRSNLNVTGSLSQRLGSESYSDTTGMLGIKYSF